MTDQHDRRRLRLVSFLGNPRAGYQPVRYELDGSVSPSTPLHDVATLLAYRDYAATVTVLGTAEVRERWFDSGNYAREIRKHAEVDAIEFQQIPKAVDEREFRELFDIVRGALDPCRAHATDATTDEPQPDVIVLDVTHGFRSHIFLAAAAVGFELSRERRSSAQTRPVSHRILYAAFDAQRDGVAPIQDLTLLIEAQQWDHAVEALMRYGRADDLDVLARRAQARQMKKQGKRVAPVQIQRIGKSAKDLADALVTGRLSDVLTAASSQLASEIERCKDDVIRYVPPLGAELDRLRDWAARLRAETVASEAGIDAALELIDLYLELDRYTEAAALLRETIVTIQSVLGEPGPLEPPRSGPNKPVRDIEANRAQAERALRSGRLSTELTELFDDIAGLRNDVQHCGLNPQPRPADTIRKELPEKLRRLRKEWARLQAKAPDEKQREVEGGAQPYFVNLSNHPLAEWSEQQVEAARSLGFGEPRDLPGGFPLVDPNADCRAIEQQAGSVASRAHELGARAAHVTGEPTMTLALVARLQDLGVECFAATTARQVRSERRAEDTIVRHVFRFVRFRRYPRVRSA